MNCLRRLALAGLVCLMAGCREPDTLFEKMSASKTNVRFANYLEESPDFNVLKYGYFYNGGGIGAGDFNNDGRIDLYFSGNLSANRLYLNQGDFTFEDITEKAGVAAADGWNTGVSVVDINADGWLDIYVCRSAAQNPKLRRNLLFINNKNLTFTEKAAYYGLDDPAYSTQAAFFDYDRDGDLDCFLLNHSVQEYAGFSRAIADFKQQQNPDYGSRLYRNDNGHFTDRTAEAGLISNVLSFGLGVAVSDFNNDGWLDLYVSNDYNENDYLYLNQQNGQFREAVRESMGHTSLYSMGSDAADVNNDGRMDLLTLDMLPERNERLKLTSGDDNYDKYQLLLRAGFHHQTMRNMLQLNLGNQPGTSPVATPAFGEIGQLAGISNTDWSWAGLFADLDNDGWKDLFITNGYARDYTNMEFLKFTMDEQLQARTTGKPSDPMAVIAKMPSISEPNYIFRNRGGHAFENKVADWGFSEPTQSNGAAYADLDNDGDQDLVVNNVNAEAGIYRNLSDKKIGNQQLTVRLEGPPAKRIGARIEVLTDRGAQYQEVAPVRGFQSSMDGPLVFGLGKTAQVKRVKIVWSDGKTESRSALAASQSQTFRYADAGPAAKSRSSDASELIEAIPARLPFTHQTDSLNDYKIQPLLPHALSGVGPCLATGDANGDGFPDIFVGGGPGQAGQVFLGQVNGWKAVPQPALVRDAPATDADAVWLDADGDRDADLLVVSAGYQLPANDPLLQPRLYLNNGKGILSKAALPDLRLSASCVRAADADGDGDADVFIGARVTPGRFPDAPPSVFLQNDGKGRFTSVADPALRTLGMVTDARWVLLGANRKPALVTAAEFGRIRLFEFASNRFQEKKDHFPAVSGCWTQLLAEDLDGDGDPDLVAGNMGLNSQLRAAPETPVKLLGMEIENRLVPVLATYENGRLFPFYARDEMLDQFTLLRKKYPDYLQFAKAEMAEVESGTTAKPVIQAEAGELRSMVFWNENGTFKAEPLLPDVQTAPVYALAAVDLDGNGHKDLILGGNQLRNRVRFGNFDANRGQVLLNSGKRQFAFLTPAQSGLWWSGAVRSLAVVRNAGAAYLLAGLTGQPVQAYRLGKRTNPEGNRR
ncbi:VCBS repeat-containing protein [Tellurirhabdus rosea]|uniref:VCBS repeat-containing protein n=1 Tax=Tellurirhabdus rosea TaxID=2674997 RepID=UPI00225AEE37|nr:VCBS repeat-containing protein [Tellurirhabdus rosea]